MSADDLAAGRTPDSSTLSVTVANVAPLPLEQFRLTARAQLVEAHEELARAIAAIDSGNILATLLASQHAWFALALARLPLTQWREQMKKHDTGEAP